MKKMTWMMAVMVLMAGCTFVEPTEQAQGVRIAYLSQVKDCKKLGHVTVSVLDKVGFITRSAEDMSEELEILARNSAAEMKGDTAVAMSKIDKGEQLFDIYRCRP